MINTKMGEAEIEYPILTILNNFGTLTTTQLKQAFRDFTQPGGDNLMPLVNRNDEAIDQIVRNIVFHRYDSSNNMIYRGFIDYSKGNLSITNAGKEYLHELSKYLFSQSMN